MIVLAHLFASSMFCPVDEHYCSICTFSLACSCLQLPCQDFDALAQGHAGRACLVFAWCLSPSGYRIGLGEQLRWYSLQLRTTSLQPFCSADLSLGLLGVFIPWLTVLLFRLFYLTFEIAFLYRDCSCALRSCHGKQLTESRLSDQGSICSNHG